MAPAGAVSPFDSAAGYEGERPFTTVFPALKVGGRFSVGSAAHDPRASEEVVAATARPSRHNKNGARWPESDVPRSRPLERNHHEA